MSLDPIISEPDKSAMERGAQTVNMPFSAKQESDEMASPSINTTRIIEAMLIAGLTSLATYVVSFPRLEQKVDGQTQQIQEIKQQLNDMRRDFYTPMTRSESKHKKGDNFDG